MSGKVRVSNWHPVRQSLREGQGRIVVRGSTLGGNACGSRRSRGPAGRALLIRAFPGRGGRSGARARIRPVLPSDRRWTTGRRVPNWPSSASAAWRVYPPDRTDCGSLVRHFTIETVCAISDQRYAQAAFRIIRLLHQLSRRSTRSPICSAVPLISIAQMRCVGLVSASRWGI